MIEFKLYKEEDLKLRVFELFTYEELLENLRKTRGPLQFYGGFSVKNTEGRGLICDDEPVQIGHLSSVSENLFEVMNEPRIHTFWFRTPERATQFYKKYSVDSETFEKEIPKVLGLPKISLLKNWYDKI